MDAPLTQSNMSDTQMPDAASPIPLSAQVGHATDRLFAIVERISAPLLRISLAVVLIWLAADKFVHPEFTVGLVRASPLYGFLATNGFAYALGVLEIVAAGFLPTNRAVRYVGLLVVLLFAGTFSIFLTTPAVTFAPPPGFPCSRTPARSCSRTSSSPPRPSRRWRTTSSGAKRRARPGRGMEIGHVEHRACSLEV